MTPDRSREAATPHAASPSTGSDLTALRALLAKMLAESEAEPPLVTHDSTLLPGGFAVVRDAHRRIVGRYPKEQAEFIVAAVNALPGLLDRLAEATEIIRKLRDTDCTEGCATDTWRALLAGTEPQAPPSAAPAARAADPPVDAEGHSAGDSGRNASDDADLPVSTAEHVAGLLEAHAASLPEGEGRRRLAAFDRALEASGAARAADAETLREALARVQRELVANQVDLDPEAARILRENLWSLLSAAPERPAADGGGR